jgi:phosphomannomutase / phosphoglucomutase
MERLVSTLAVICVLMVIIAGSGAFLLSKMFVAQSKVDAVSAVAKGVALTLSEQVNLLNSMLDKMAQDPDVINAAVQYNPDLLAGAATKLENHFPGALSIKFWLPENNDPSKKTDVTMGYADLEMAKKTFIKDQLTAIQGDIASDRHLAIARRIMQNGSPIGVVLAGLNYDFISKILAASTLGKGYIELRQGNLVLASAGKKHDQEEIDNAPIPVPNTDWGLYYDNSSATSANSVVEFSLMVAIILVPSLMVALGFVVGYRKLSDLLTKDMAWVTKAFKEILTEKPLGDYPVQVNEIKNIISTLAQFKRVLNDKRIEM